MDYKTFFLKKAEFYACAKEIADLSTSRMKYDFPEVAFIGRSNVGKSSLINAICGVKGLAITSKTPGRTRQINFFALYHAMGGFLVDLPGYGFAKVSDDAKKQWNKLIMYYLGNRTQLKHIFWLIDGRHDMQKVDYDFLEILKYHNNIPFSVVLTKIDKCNEGDINNIAEKIIYELPPDIGFSGKCFGFSIHQPDLYEDIRKEIFEICKVAFIR